MSSCSSDPDVIKTRISTCDTCDGDNTVLYAYEPNTACVNDASVVSEACCPEEQQKTVEDVLSHCEVIYDAIKNLDKKFDVITGKVSKIYRMRVKTLSQNRKLLGYAYKSYHLLSKKIKLQKSKKRALSPSSYTCHESYSPTVPVERGENDYQSHAYHSYNSPDPKAEAIYDNQDIGLSPTPSNHSSIFQHTYQPYYTPDNPPEGYPAGPGFPDTGPQGTNSIFSSVQTSTAVSTAIMAQGRASAINNAEMITYPPLLENNTLSCTTSSFCIPAGFIGTDQPILKQSCTSDPSAWSIDEVILFLQYTDPHMLTYLADLFRQHDIDGKALLLLNSDMMMKYWGLKLGTAVKLCHYIEKLKGGKYFNY
ncbi:sex comb on midleg-like protein 1 isoform X2 [Rhinolophus ferrumequinum]|uniref:sex comb on midleg-like protein 1 isoform X2 n=1 Tax=Rhinolophus ferrumequinum TaxID=59479 RepID=UPI00140F967D|nr:sex comb on midleg-like protein 1 isoform X2 [Rhinolophus ferrumequinum]